MVSIKKLRQQVASGELDALLERLYCRKPGGLAPYRERLIRTAENYVSIFKKNDDAQICVCSAAGRTEIGGNHTDHQRGRVLTGSVDLDALACAAANGTGTIRVFSEGFGMTEVDGSIPTPLTEEKNTTAALIRGIMSGLRSEGYMVAGFDAYVTSDVPAGSGLSSSACFEVLMGVVMNHLFCNDRLDMAGLARIGQYAENVYFGKPSGLMDQMGCAVGGIISIDFRDKEHPVYHAVDIDFSEAGYALCIVDSGADHADLTDAYASIPQEMHAVAAVFGREVLNEVDENDFFANLAYVRETAGDRPVLRAVHYYSDCRRVDEEVAALEAGNFDRFLQLVRESGNSSFMYLQNISTFRAGGGQPVAFALAAAEHALQGCGAFRVHGGGFAGTIQAFVPIGMVESFCCQMDAALGGGSCRVMHIRPVGGCVVAE